MAPVPCGTVCMLVSEIGWAVLLPLARAGINLPVVTCIGFMVRSSLMVFFLNGVTHTLPKPTGLKLLLFV